MSKQDKQPKQFFEEAADAYMTTVQAGLKAQEEATRHWMDFMKGFPAAPDPAKQGREAVDDTVARMKEATHETFELMEKNAQQSLDLMSQGLAAANADSVGASQDQFRKMWEDSLKSFRGNVDAMLKLNTDTARVRRDGRQTEEPGGQLVAPAVLAGVVS